MIRRHDWPACLDAAIEAARGQRFAYGTFDCALFAASCAEAMTGVDYAAELRGYSTPLEAARLVSRYGSLEAMVTALLGREPIHPAFASRGDVVLATIPLVEHEAGETLGICVGPRCAFPQAVGLVFRPRAEARLAWRIG